MTFIAKHFKTLINEIGKIAKTILGGRRPPLKED